MQNWVAINLGDAQLASYQLIKLQQNLVDLYHLHGEPNSFAAYYRHESNGLHCYLSVFLTLEFQHVTKLENTVQCESPEFNDLSFLAGNPDYLGYSC